MYREKHIEEEIIDELIDYIIDEAKKKNYIWRTTRICPS